jgi:hypothetical protein
MSGMRSVILGASSALAVLLAGAGTALAQTGPSCPPATLDNSALLDGAITVSPIPGSRDATPQTQVSFVGAPAGDLSVVSVVGSETGSHSGRLEAYSQGDGASFLPSRPFAEGERVTVSAVFRSGGHSHQLTDTFAVAHEDLVPTTPRADHPGTAAEEQHFQSRPDLRPPLVTVTADSAGVSPGDVFLAPYGGPGQAGPMILEPDGALVWFHPLPANVSATNFRVQQYEGQPVLTWWEGDISGHGYGLGNDLIVGGNYEMIADVKAGNGLFADLHEFQLTPRGTALITAYDPIYCNLSAVGGPADGAVTDGVFQEVDIRTGLVRMQWTTVDHVGLAESYEKASTSSLEWPFDFFHINSLNLDANGNLLVSARNTWTIYNVNARTGQVLWRLGGKASSFAEAPGTQTAWQHDPRELPDGMLSVFDNGSSPTVHTQSRGEIVSLNPGQGTATLVAQLTHGPPLVAESQGNVQAMANGNWFIGWGQAPYVSEFGPTGELLFDAHLPSGDESYRGFRFPWSGAPAHGPALSYQPGAGAGTAYASWNGATAVSSWRLLAGSSATSLAPVASVARTGFETAITVPVSMHGAYLAVQALGATGQVIGSSGAIAGP